MLRDTYLHENIMFTIKANQNIAWGEKGKDRATL